MILRARFAAPVAVVAVLFTIPAAAAPEGTVNGTVVDESGNAVAQAKVTASTPSQPTFNVELQSDATGRFDLTVPNIAWTYTIRVEHDGFSPTQMQVKVPTTKPYATFATLHPPIGGPPPPKVDPGIAAYNDGVDLLQKGDKAGAQKKFEDAVASKPDLTAAWKVLSQLAYESKDYAKTLADGRKLLELDPNDKELYGILMDSAMKTGDAAAAADYKKKYYEANGDKPEINFNAGVEAYNGGDYQGAIAYFTKATTLKADLANAYFWLAMSQYNLKQNGAARQNFQKYLELAPQGDQAQAAHDMLTVLPK